MRNITDIIPEEFLLMRQEYLTLLLKKLPLVKAGRRGVKPVFRVYKDKRHYRELSSTNREWEEIKNLYNQRIKIETSLEQTKRLLSGVHHRKGSYSFKVLNKRNRLNSSYYDSLADDSCTFEKESEYYYKGYNFRSRSEMLFATILDEFGLEYKYDVKVNFAGRVFSVDFVIIFRELNRCIFIEYYGKCQDREYTSDNGRKLLHAQADGVYIGRDYFILSGDKTYAPGPDVIRVFVAGIIAQVSCEQIKIVD